MTEVEEILADQSKAVKDALAKIDARYYVRGKLRDERQRSSLLDEYNAVLDSYLSGIIIADGRIPDFFTKQFEVRKAQIVTEAKRAILKALTTAQPRGLPPIPVATAMKHVTEKLESELLGAATFYDERFNAILSHAKLSEDGIPLYLYLTSGSGNSCDVCAASNLKLYEETDIDFELPRHPNCRCVLVPFTEEVELEFTSSNYARSKPSDKTAPQQGGIDTDTVLDVVQTLLDVAGLIPVVGEVFDGANALISLGRGNYVDAALSVASMVPVVGWAGTGAKFVHKGVKYADEVVGAAVKVGKEVVQHADEAVEVVAKAGREAAQHADEAAETFIKAAKGTSKAIMQKELFDKVEAAFLKETAGRAYLGGKAGEMELDNFFKDGISQKQYKTSKTRRVVDRFADNIIHESKVGYKGLSEALKMQAIKDGLIIAEDEVLAWWHFFRSEITGSIGASKNLLEFLEDQGIKYSIHW